MPLNNFLFSTLAACVRPPARSSVQSRVHFLKPLCRTPCAHSKSERRPLWRGPHRWTHAAADLGVWAPGNVSWFGTRRTSAHLLCLVVVPFVRCVIVSQCAHQWTKCHGATFIRIFEPFTVYCLQACKLTRWGQHWHRWV